VSGHTPGPWIVRARPIPYKDGSKSHVERSICQQRIDPQLKDHLPVVCMSMGVGMDGEKAVLFMHIKEEDARLIAAAPSMLSELHKARTALQEHLDDLIESHTHPDTGLITDGADLLAIESEQDLINGIDRVIAQAEGHAAT
jgi:hypothetical protein